jgi:urea carboxylase-associated protein 2
VTETGTDTTRAAREHARAQAGTAAEAMPTVPPSSWPDPPAGVDPAALTWAETVAGGGYSSKVLTRGTTLRLTDLEGDACAHLLLYNADQPWERLNVADTVKIPWQAYLGEGNPLLSDQGRILGLIVGDSSGRHDALCGTTALATNVDRYGEGSPQGPSPAGRELQLLAAAKHGLGPRDIPPSLSFFQGVRVDGEGALHFEGSAGAGAAVEVRIEMPAIAIVANVPHPLDPRPEYTATTLELLAWRGDPTRPEDGLWSQTPELERAFLNTKDYCDARGIG